ncbi:MAG: peptidylprolyl isomerase [Candidatus Limnocylindrales bacterium]
MSWVRRAVALTLGLGLCLAACGPSGATSAGPTTSALGHRAPPDATPQAAPPAAPVPGGGTATIQTPEGAIVIQLYGGSAPVATANFVQLSKSGYYDGVVFQRIVPGFVIQGGDGQFGREPAVDMANVGSGGPGYTIVDEPVVGDYTRGVVAMARTSQPDSQGSQFFICLADLRGQLDKAGDYVIFGHVTQGMDVVDRIAAGPSSGPPAYLASQPVPMTSVVITP